MPTVVEIDGGFEYYVYPDSGEVHVHLDGVWVDTVTPTDNNYGVTA